MEKSALMDGIITEAMPEAVGIASEHIANYLNCLREMDYDIHSFQIVRNDKIVFSAAAEPYTLQSPHRLLSAAKAIIGAAVLFAIDEGKLCFEDRITDYFEDKLPHDLDERFRRITVYDLLTMQTGQETDEAFLHFLENPDEDLCESFFRTPMTCEPGTHFFYNNSVPHLLFFLAERAVGRDIASWLKEKLCKPLGIDIIAQYNDDHIYDPVTTVVTADGFLKLALWFLKEGEWKGRQLIDPALIRQACTRQVWTNNQEPGYHNGKGYCMQLWKNAFGGCRMDGGGGQIALILPEENMAVTIMGNESRGDQAVRLFYEEIYSKMCGRPLPENPEGKQILERAAQRMSRAPKHVKPHSPTETLLKNRIWRFDSNEWGIEEIAFDFEEKEGKLHVKQKNETCIYHVGLKAEWGSNLSPFLLEPDLSIQNRIYGPDPEHCFLSGGWQDDETFVILCKSLAAMGEYPFCCTFKDNKLTLQIPKGISAGMKPEAGWSCLKSI